MNKVAKLQAVFVCFFLLFHNYAFSVPTTISYQAYLTDALGSPLNTNGSPISFRFALYTTDVGESLVWSETQSLEVNKGLFNVQLGVVNPLLLPDYFNVPLFLGVAVGADLEMLPRTPITLSAYAVKALDAETLQGVTPTELDQSSHIFSFNNPHDVSAAQIGALSNSELLTHKSDSSAHHPVYTDANAVYAIKNADGSGSGIDADLLDGLHASHFSPSVHLHDDFYYSRAEVDDLINYAVNQATLALNNRIIALENKLASMSLQTVNGHPTVRFTGVNLQVVNGEGSTDSANGTGNIIVGYDEKTGTGSYYCTVGFNASASQSVSDQPGCIAAGGAWVNTGFKTGSHYFVSGQYNNYSRWGGIIAGVRNISNYDFASVTGGYLNKSSGRYTVVSGGLSNTAKWDNATVSGGYSNTASSNNASVSGGSLNIASGPSASVSGGLRNVASSEASSINGGLDNTTSDLYTSINGGRNNVASGYAATVSGGSDNEANGNLETLLGSPLTVYTLGDNGFLSLITDKHQYCSMTYDWTSQKFYQSQDVDWRKHCGIWKNEDGTWTFMFEAIQMDQVICQATCF